VNWFKSFWKALTTPPVRESRAASSRGDQTKPTPPLTAPPASESHDFLETANSLSPRAQKVLELARGEAGRFHHHFVGTEHLLLGLISLGQGTAVNVLGKLGLKLEAVRAVVEAQVPMGPNENPLGNIPYTPRVKKVLALAAKEAKALNDTYLGTEHILLGLLREGDGVAARVLTNLGVEIEQTRLAILRELGEEVVGKVIRPQ
jgi:ATP-dependent Clp protease ATP-binding subunit ClpC